MINKHIRQMNPVIGAVSVTLVLIALAACGGDDAQKTSQVPVPPTVGGQTAGPAQPVQATPQATAPHPHAAIVDPTIAGLRDLRAAAVRALAMPAMRVAYTTEGHTGGIRTVKDLPRTPWHLPERIRAVLPTANRFAPGKRSRGPVLWLPHYDVVVVGVPPEEVAAACVGERANAQVATVAMPLIRAGLGVPAPPPSARAPVAAAASPVAWGPDGQIRANDGRRRIPYRSNISMSSLGGIDDAQNQSQTAYPAEGDPQVWLLAIPRPAATAGVSQAPAAQDYEGITHERVGIRENVDFGRWTTSTDPQIPKIGREQGLPVILFGRVGGVDTAIVVDGGAAHPRADVRGEDHEIANAFSYCAAAWGVTGRMAEHPLFGKPIAAAAARDGLRVAHAAVQVFQSETSRADLGRVIAEGDAIAPTVAEPDIAPLVKAALADVGKAAANPDLRAIATHLARVNVPGVSDLVPQIEEAADLLDVARRSPTGTPEACATAVTAFHRIQNVVSALASRLPDGPAFLHDDAVVATVLQVRLQRVIVALGAPVNAAAELKNVETRDAADAQANVAIAANKAALTAAEAALETARQKLATAKQGADLAALDAAKAGVAAAETAVERCRAKPTTPRVDTYREKRIADAKAALASLPVDIAAVERDPAHLVEIVQRLATTEIHAAWRRATIAAIASTTK